MAESEFVCVLLTHWQGFVLVGCNTTYGQVWSHADKMIICAEQAA